tara:strand:+ start:74 stop:613 length:540 start_codon:yes stop_codon:yes gene_type:complete
MKNGDLYKLGCTNNLEVEAKKMKPGEIISSFKTNNPKSFQVRLFKLYKKRRIPDTNYFRLSESEVDNCKKHLEGKTNLPKSLSEEIRIGLTGSLLFASLIFLISFLITKIFIFSIFLSIVFASFPMWSLAILGSFGGYDIEDLNLFSTFSNRIKGFSIAISMISIAYVVYTLYHFSINF